MDNQNGNSTVENIPILYVFVRTDMPSMTPGKAQAHSGHAANAFIFKNYISKLNNGDKVPDAVLEWMRATPQGFGTQINLKGNWNDVVKVAAQVQEDKKGLCDLVEDPTYPYLVDSEIAGLINHKIHSVPPIDLGNGKVACHRAENTAVYIFGYKDDLKPYLGEFPLHP